MSDIAIMTDTNSGIVPSLAKKYGIHLLKMPYMVNAREHWEYGDISYEKFFELLDTGAEVSTSQPSPSHLIEMWDKLLKTHSAVIYIPMSSGLSGTCSTAKMLAEEYEGRVCVVDNKRISLSQRESVFDALYLSRNDISAPVLADYLEKEGSNQSIYVSVNTLEHLKKSGRVTPAGAAIGTLLGIKPVLEIQGGKLDAFKKVRGMKSAMEAMLNAIEHDYQTRFRGQNVRISAAYSGSLSQGKEWQSMVKKRFPGMEIVLDALPISISCHVGGGALGICIAKALRPSSEP